jgi:DNA-binding XRE family transcriptional regulator
MSLNERISKVIEYSNLTSSEFADEIDVQRSSISHITSGRNKPSLEFIIKIKSRFPEILWDWLITGEGEMLKSELPESDIPELEEKFTKRKNRERLLYPIFLRW